MPNFVKFLCMYSVYFMVMNLFYLVYVMSGSTTVPAAYGNMHSMTVSDLDYVTEMQLS